jgi:hypothetical protein
MRTSFGHALAGAALGTGIVCAGTARAEEASPQPAPGQRPSPEVQVFTGPGAYASSWRGDAQVGQALKLGFRFADLVAIDALTRLGYASVNERVVTYLSLGTTIYGRIRRVRPWARLALVHQHEESTSALRDDPFGALFGVGNGIRHRGGFGSALGFDVPVYTDKKAEFVFGADVSGVYFPDPRGPALYGGGSLWAGLNYGL